MLSARIKAIFVLLFATIVIMAVTVKNTPPVSEYMQTGIRLSDLPDLERTEFMVAKVQPQYHITTKPLPVFKS